MRISGKKALVLIILFLTPFTILENAQAGDDAVPEGKFTLLTYNIAGLPSGLSSSEPVRNIPVISPLLNAYDAVVVQEDFAYHHLLLGEDIHAYRTEPAKRWSLGDGLNNLAWFPMIQLARKTWKACSGIIFDDNDCLAPKGFMVSKAYVNPDSFIYLYNIHMDAGRSADDEEARTEQAGQLLADIEKRAKGSAVIIAGDTNLNIEKSAEDEKVFTELVSNGGFTDVCHAVHCEEESIDRVLIRSGENLVLQPLSWALPREFVNDDGEDLSDHKPVLVNLGWAHVDNVAVNQ